MPMAALLISLVCLSTFVAIINADETFPHPWTVARKMNETTTSECGRIVLTHSKCKFCKLTV